MSTDAELRQFLTTMQEFGVFECSVGDMTFKIAPVTPGIKMTREPEDPDERRERIRKEMEAIVKEDEEMTYYST